jgi:cholesterol transport system auxiliary component
MHNTSPLSRLGTPIRRHVARERPGGLAASPSRRTAGRTGFGRSLALLLGLGALSAGCNGLQLSRPAPVKHYYLLELPAEAAPAEPTFVFPLKVTGFDVAPPFEDRALVYRIDEQRYESDFYSEFFVTPRAMVTSRIAEWLAARRIFSATLPPSSALDAPYAMEGLVTAMYGDLRPGAEPAAVFSLQVFVTQTGTPQRRIMLERTYGYEVRVPDRSAESIARGLSQVFQHCLADLEKDLRALQLPPP